MYLYFTDEVVDVTPITDQYPAALHDVPIAGGALHLSLDKGLGYLGSEPRFTVWRGAGDLAA